MNYKYRQGNVIVYDNAFYSYDACTAKIFKIVIGDENFSFEQVNLNKFEI